MRANAEIERPDDNQTNRKTTTNSFLIRLKADRCDSSVHALRWLLKTAKRRFGMTALSVTEEAVERRESAA